MLFASTSVAIRSCKVYTRLTNFEFTIWLLYDSCSIHEPGATLIYHKVRCSTFLTSCLPALQWLYPLHTISIIDSCATMIYPSCLPNTSLCCVPALQWLYSFCTLSGIVKDLSLWFATLVAIIWSEILQKQISSLLYGCSIIHVQYMIQVQLWSITLCDDLTFHYGGC